MSYTYIYCDHTNIFKTQHTHGNTHTPSFLCTVRSPAQSTYLSLARVSACDGGRTHTAVSNSKSDEAQRVFSQGGAETRQHTDQRQRRCAQRPPQSLSCLPCMSETSMSSLFRQLLMIGKKWEWERERAKDEHVANRTRLDLEVEWWDSVVTTFHPGFFFLSKCNKDAG